MSLGGGGWFCCFFFFFLFFVLFFFFKQKTAYEIKECDWSSDVCSSDLDTHILLSNGSWKFLRDIKVGDEILSWNGSEFIADIVVGSWKTGVKKTKRVQSFGSLPEIGRASCRERV